MDHKLIAFLSMQITTLPLVIAYAIGLAIGYSRRDLGKRATLGISGFGLLLSSQLVAMYANYLMAYEMEPGSAAQMGKTIAKLTFLRMSLALGGVIALIGAAFHRPESPQLSERSAS